ncbi:hypothetical protein DC429_11195 [Arthrobacter sp. TPD3018]|nr:hypothetical protein DC425_11185 [Sphingomonas sp. TPD3009]PVE57627.1 hypothetical protein DC429_11195 [Arthrobacter sp. TPD3018]PVE83251.1 hypothetical protein DC431_11185 [Sphingomonas melonis]
MTVSGQAFGAASHRFPSAGVAPSNFVIPANAGIHGRGAGGFTRATAYIVSMDPGVRRDDEWEEVAPTA